MSVSTVGVIGGMGPEASNRFCQLILALTGARQDQDHIPVIHFNNPQIPNRSEAILAGGADPTPSLIQTARTLDRAGAHFLVMPCNSAHAYMDSIARAVNVPVVSMIEETARKIKADFGQSDTVIKIGILATTQTINAALYQSALPECEFVVPSSGAQEKVMESIYGTSGLKAGKQSEAIVLLTEVVQELTDRGVELLLVGCTEISLVIPQLQTQVSLVDSMSVLAQATVERAQQGFGLMRTLAAYRKPSEQVGAMHARSIIATRHAPSRR